MVDDQLCTMDLVTDSRTASIYLEAHRFIEGKGVNGEMHHIRTGGSRFQRKTDRCGLSKICNPQIRLQSI